MATQYLSWIALTALGCGGSRAMSLDAGGFANDAPSNSDAFDASVTDGMAPSCQASGILDTSFGSGGVTPILGLQPNESLWLAGVRIDSEARIVAAGAFHLGSRSCLLTRMLPDGRFDPSFGANGIVRHTVGDHECWYSDLAIQGDGKIVAVGSIDGLTSPRALIARYLADGTPDLTFGEQGVVISRALPEPATQLLAIEIDAQERIVVAGGAYSGPLGAEVYSYLTRRHLSDGRLDPSFGTGGIADLPFRNGFDEAYDLAIQANGRIVVNGTANTTPATAINAKFGIVGYTPDGKKDPTFGTNGVVFVDGEGTGIARDGQDRVVAVGQHLQEAAVLPSLLQDGGVDSTLEDPDVPSGYTEVAIDALGRSVAVGTSGPGHVVLTRYTHDGRDLTFGASGFAVGIPLGGIQEGLDVAIQADGRIVTIGRYGFSDQIDAYVARYCP